MPLNSGSQQSGNVTTTQNNTMLVAGVAVNYAASFDSVSNSFTERAETTSGTPDVVSADRSVTSAGTYGTTATQNPNPISWQSAGVVIALNEASSEPSDLLFRSSTLRLKVTASAVVAASIAYRTRTGITSAVSTAPKLSYRDRLAIPSVFLPTTYDLNARDGQLVMDYRALQTVIASSIASQETLGTAVLSPGGVAIVHSSIASTEAFGTATMVASGASIQPGSITSGMAMGAHTLLPGEVSILAGSITSAQAFGTAVLLQGGVHIYPTGIFSAEATGTALIIPGVARVLPSGIASAEVKGAPVFYSVIRSSVTGIASAEQMGLQVVYANTNVRPGGISSAEAFGTSYLYSIAYLTAGAIFSAEAFGSARVQPGEVRLLPSSVPFTTGFGSHTLLPGNVNIITPSIAYLSALGAPGFIFDPVYGVLIVSVYNQTPIDTQVRAVAGLQPAVLPEAKITTAIWTAARVEAKAHPAVSITTEVRRYYEDEP